MAYIDQQKKAEFTPQVKQILRKYGIKGSLSIQHYSTLVLTIASGPIDFIGNFNRVGAVRSRFDSALAKDSLEVNVYWYREHFDGQALAFLGEVIPIMNEGNHDRSDMMTDYYDVGWYVTVRIGRWDRPYQLIGNDNKVELSK